MPWRWQGWGAARSGQGVFWGALWWGKVFTQHRCWLLAVSFRLQLDLKVPAKVQVPPVRVLEMQRSGALEQAQ